MDQAIVLQDQPGPYAKLPTAGLVDTLPMGTAVNSYVTNGNCAGATYSNRVDLPDVLSFINSF